MLAGLHFVPAEGWLKFALYMIPYFISGYDIIIKAFKGIKNRQPLDECLLMVVATVGAIVLGLFRTGDYVEAVAVMVFYQTGEWFQSYAVGKSRKNITELMNICPDYASIMGENGQLQKTDPDDVEPGSVIYVEPGERIPIDSVVLEGRSAVDTSALTGESVPRNVSEGDEVLSGCINMTGLLKLETLREFGESTASRIMELIEDASSRKSRSENFISKFARIYTPAVVVSALVLAVAPPLVLMMLGNAPDWGTWVYRALTFLVISCPCALVISIPLSFFGGIGAASSRGILIKGSNYLETLSEVKTIAFDKTGTLTRGVFEVTAVHPEKISEHELLHIAAHVERYSNHPIAASIRQAFPDEADECSVEQVEEIPGKGVKAVVNSKEVWVGNSKMMDACGVKWRACHKNGTVIHVAADGEYAGHIVISDVMRDTTAEAVAALKAAGIRKTVMLTGDTAENAEPVGREAGVDRIYAGLLPGDKVRIVEELMEEDGRQKLAFVGDGINDAPVLSRADIGIAMGALGSDAAIEAADVVLMDDDPMKIATAIRISGKCLRIVKENIWFAIGVKLVCLALSAAGIGSMWLAIFADVGVMVLAVLNALRCLLTS